MTDRPTYPELLKLFYKHSFPDKLGAPASAVAQAIIYKSNELWFPAEFAMSNKELSQLSGEKLSNIGRTRQKVLETCLIGKQPLFIYVNGVQRKAGMYKINFNLTSTELQDDFKMTSNSRQKHPEIDNDPNLTLPNETKLNNKPSAPLPENEDEERHDRITDALKKAIGSRDITLVSNDYQRAAFDALMEYPDEKILHVIQVAGEKGKLHQDNAITYVKNGLENYDSWYANPTGGNGGGIVIDAEKRDAERMERMLKDQADFRARGLDDLADKVTKAIAEAEGK